MQAAAGQPDPTSAGADADGDAVTSSLKIGDIISLFALEAFGFLRADGFVTNDLTVNPLDVKVSPAASPDISDCRAGSIVTAHPAHSPFFRRLPSAKHIACLFSGSRPAEF